MMFVVLSICAVVATEGSDPYNLDDPFPVNATTSSAPDESQAMDVDEHVDALGFTQDVTEGDEEDLEAHPSLLAQLALNEEQVIPAAENDPDAVPLPRVEVNQVEEERHTELAAGADGLPRVEVNLVEEHDDPEDEVSIA